ncbi:WxL domain-containing protein [Lapidilactobacillus luobeiensis]|uniref:WxL domain-containing protein n=1 Tax=Lapidilactobacillus luobeiensis TaxID=2950371 RepID=UPI0021C45159|nr:WxL domain-containing protein [Lapidilactobacillus luobeiensis]
MLRKTKLFLIFGTVFALFLMAPRPVLGDAVDSHASIPLSGGGTTDPVDPRDPQDPDTAYPGDDQDPGNKGTGSTESLSLDYVSNLHFGEKDRQTAISADLLNQNAMVQVTDQRGSGTGWVLQLKPGLLVGEKTGTVLKSGQLDLGSLMTLKTTSDNVSKAPQIVTQKIYLGDYVNLIRASDLEGRGLWVLGISNKKQPAKLNLTLPQEVPADHYVGTLNWSLSDAPN